MKLSEMISFHLCRPLLLHQPGSYQVCIIQIQSATQHDSDQLELLSWLVTDRVINRSGKSDSCISWSTRLDQAAARTCRPSHAKLFFLGM